MAREMRKQEKGCLACGRKIQGRSDKRFCDDACRNAYHNTYKSTQEVSIRTINGILRKNRAILARLLGAEQLLRIRRDQLLQEGFNLHYHTHQLTTSKGKCYLFIYDYGYLLLSEQEILVVKSKM